MISSNHKKSLFFNDRLPNGWQILAVDSIKSTEKYSCSAGPFGSNISSQYFVDQGIPVIRGGNLTIGKEQFIADNFVFITEDKARSFPGQHVKADDLVFTCWGTLGQVGLIPKNGPYPEYIISNKQLKLRPDPKKCNSKFLYYYFTLPQMVRHINDIAIGSAVPGINLGLLKNIKLVLPPKEQQDKIAAILSAYDDLIENNKRRIALLEKMAEEIYREWFVRFRFPGYQTAEFEKGIPKGWRVNTLGNISIMVMGQSPSSEFYNEIGDGLPFHQGVGTYGNRFPENKYYCSVIGRVANKGDILFSVRAPVGRLNIANEKMIIGRGLAAISHKNGRNSYLYYFLKTAFSNEDIIGNGSIFNSVGKDELKGFKLLSPPKELEEKFNQIAQNIDEQITCLINSVKNLEKTKNMLLPRLISGKLSVEHLDIQFPPSMQEGDVI